MVTIDVRITNKQLEFLKRKAGKHSVPDILTKMVADLLDSEMEDEKDGKTTTN